LKASIEAATAPERAFGIRATLASKKIQEWLNELLSWPWPSDGGSEGFEMPASGSKRESFGKTHLDNRYERHGSRDPDEEEYMGSLLAGVVDQYHVRIEEIMEDMEDLDVEAIKRKVLETHVSSKSRPTSSSSTNSTPRTLPAYTKMDDFTAIVTATVIYALPNLSKLLRLMDIWKIRLLVLQRVPPLLFSLEEIEAALKSGWDVLEKSVYDYGQETGPGEFLLSRNTFGTMQGVLQDKVTRLGRDIDFMLDTLEGREDTLPEAWLDRMELVENDYGEWVVACDQMIRKGEWETMARARKLAEDAKKAEAARVEEEERMKAAAVKDARKFAEDTVRLEEARMAKENTLRAEAFDRERLKAEEDLAAQESVARLREAAQEATKSEDARLEQEEMRKAGAIEAKRLKGEEEARSIKEEPPKVEAASLGKTPYRLSEEESDYENLKDVCTRVAGEDDEKPVSTETSVIPSTPQRNNISSVELQRPFHYEASSDSHNVAQNAIGSAIAAGHRVLDVRSPVVNDEGHATPAMLHAHESEKGSVQMPASINATAHPEPTPANSEDDDIGVTSLEVPDVLTIEPSFSANEVAMTSLPGTPPASDRPCAMVPASTPHNGNTNSLLASLSHADFSPEVSVNSLTDVGPAMFRVSEPVGDNKSIVGDQAGDDIDQEHDSTVAESLAPVVSSPRKLIELEGELDGVNAAEENFDDELFQPAYEAWAATNTANSVARPQIKIAGHWTFPAVARVDSARSASSDSARSQASAPSGRTSKRHGRNISVANDPSFFIDGVMDEIDVGHSPTTSPITSNDKHVGEDSSPHYDPDTPPTASALIIVDRVIVPEQNYSPAERNRLRPRTESEHESVAVTTSNDAKDSRVAVTDGHVGEEKEKLQTPLGIKLEPQPAQPVSDGTQATENPHISSSSFADATPRGSISSNGSTVVARWGDDSSSLTSKIRGDDSLPTMKEQPPSVASAESTTLQPAEITPSDSPPLTTTIPRAELLDSPTSPTFSLSDASTTSADAPVFGDIDVVTVSLSSPKKSTEDQLQQQISSLLESIPAQIHLTSGPNSSGSGTLKPKKTRKSVTAAFRPHSSLTNRPQTPSFLLAPAYSKTVPRPKSQYAHPEIKVYHLSRSTGEAPIKLFVRLVGENGERVMVRVGGGWADLGEYLKEYASHHGRRSTAEEKIEIQDLPSRIGSSSSTASTATINGGDSGRLSPVPTIRPTSAFDRAFSNLNVRKNRKSLGENVLQGSREYRSPSTPIASVNRRSLGENFSSSTGPSRSSSRLSWTDDDVSLGLAGPKGKKTLINEEDQEWVDSMKEKVRQASAEKNRGKEMERRLKERGASFGEMEKVGSTKRLFRKA
jgi:hypothetical protein